MSFVLELSFSSDRLSSGDLAFFEFSFSTICFGFRFRFAAPFSWFFVVGIQFDGFPFWVAVGRRLVFLLLLSLFSFFLPPPFSFFFFFSFRFRFRFPLSGSRHDGIAEIGGLSRFGDRSFLVVGMGCVGTTNWRHLANGK